MPILKCFRVVAFLACVVFLAGCAPVEEESGAASFDASSSEPVGIAVPASASEGSPDTVTEPGVITRESLIDTTWAIADYSVTFEADGIVRFNSGSTGTWSLTDGTILIAAAGAETVIDIEGDQLMQNGMTLERQ